MKIQRVSGDLLAQIAALEAACFAEPWSAASLALLTNAPNVGFVVMEGERVCAYGGMLCVLDEGQITNIAVQPDMRRRGYARAVLFALCQYARENELTEITLEVRCSNEAAIGLYKGSGFLCVGQRRGFYRHPTEDALIMKKTLAN